LAVVFLKPIILKEFWQLLSNGIDGITEIPKERWKIWMNIMMRIPKHREK
jgi:hypothetical protein